MERFVVVADYLGEFIGSAQAKNLRFSFINKAGRALIGLGEDEDVSRISLTELFGEETLQEISSQWLPALSKEGSYRGQSTIVTRQGQMAPVMVSLHASSEKGNITVILRAIEDIRVKARLQHLVGASHVVLYACKADGEFGATYVSDNITKIFGYSPEDFTTNSAFWAEHIHPDDRKRVFDELAELFVHGHYDHEYRFLHQDGSYRWVHDVLTLTRDEEGEPVEIIGSWQDITERKRIETTIREQTAALMEMSTPLIPINDQILVMPIVGSLSAERAARVLEALLDGISKSRASVAILDITGVVGVDTYVANSLLMAARAVRLLGAQVVLTGIRPEVAQTLIRLDVDLDGVVTCSNLEAGIAYAMRERSATKR